MAKAGRPRKSGKRYSNGRLKPDAPRFDQGSEWVQAQRARYGEHYCWAMGRAFAAGLLGEPQEAKARLDTANLFVLRYKRFLGGKAYTCPLDQSPRGNNVVELEITDRQQADHDWLMRAMDSMDMSGGRPYFDALISVLHVDTGPFWLDALLSGGKHPVDQAFLKAAIAALDTITPETTRSRIVAQVY